MLLHIQTLHPVRMFDRGVDSVNMEAEPSCVRRHHIYKHTWTPCVGEEREVESGNNKDPYAEVVFFDLFV